VSSKSINQSVGRKRFTKVNSKIRDFFGIMKNTVLRLILLLFHAKLRSQFPLKYSKLRKDFGYLVNVCR